MCRFKIYSYLIFDILLNLNTSHVSVQARATLQREGAVLLFKYISCVGSSYRDYCHNSHITYLNTSHVSVQVILEETQVRVLTYLNTSHVSVQAD